MNSTKNDRNDSGKQSKFSFRLTDAFSLVAHHWFCDNNCRQPPSRPPAGPGHTTPRGEGTRRHIAGYSFNPQSNCSLPSQRCARGGFPARRRARVISWLSRTTSSCNDVRNRRLIDTTRATTIHFRQMHATADLWPVYGALLARAVNCHARERVKHLY